MSDKSEATAKKQTDFTKPLRLSNDLAAVLGTMEGEKRSRAQVVRGLWAYMKEHKLQDPENRQFFTPDKMLEPIFGKEKIKAFWMVKYLKGHLTDDRENSDWISPDKVLVDKSEMQMKAAMSTNIGKLLQSGESSDFKIICMEKIFPVHRNILTCSSSVFHSMLTNDSLESPTSQMIIEDMAAETVEDILNFIYTGRVENLDKKAMDLFVGADRYNLPALKDACVEAMISGLTVSNALDLLVLADMHHSEKLKAAAKKLVVEKSREIVEQKRC